MSHRPQATMFFGVELTEFHEYDFSDDAVSDDVMPYDYGWEERIAAKLNITQEEGEDDFDFEKRIVEKVGVIFVNAGDDNHDTLTIGVAETVVNCDWDYQAEIPFEHPIWRYATKGGGIGGNANLWISKMQKFCDNMLNVKMDIEALYRKGKVGWRLAAYYPSA